MGDLPVLDNDDGDFSGDDGSGGDDVSDIDTNSGDGASINDQLYCDKNYSVDYEHMMY